MINVLLLNFNSSQMLEFDDSLFLFSKAMSLTTRIFFFPWFVCMELLSFTFEISTVVW